MGDGIGKQTASEIRLLPYTLGKLAGGAMAVIGFPGMLFRINKKPEIEMGDILPFLICGILGIGIFVYFSRLLAKRLEKAPEPVPTAKERVKTSILAWLGFALFIGIFLSITFMMAR